MLCKDLWIQLLKITPELDEDFKMSILYPQFFFFTSNFKSITCKKIIYLFIWLHQVLAVAFGVQFPDQGSYLGPLHWKCRDLATGLPGKSLYCIKRKPKLADIDGTLRVLFIQKRCYRTTSSGSLIKDEAFSFMIKDRKMNIYLPVFI